METTIWDSLSFFSQLEHILFFLLLSAPVVAFVLHTAATAVDAGLRWVAEEDYYGCGPTEKIADAVIDRFTPRSEAGEWIVLVWAMFGTALAIVMLITMNMDPADPDDPWTFEPLPFVWSFVKFIVLAYILRYAYRIVKWVRRMAAVAHSHTETGDVKDADLDSPTFK